MLLLQEKGKEAKALPSLNLTDVRVSSTRPTPWPGPGKPIIPPPKDVRVSSTRPTWPGPGKPIISPPSDVRVPSTRPTPWLGPGKPIISPPSDVRVSSTWPTTWLGPGKPNYIPTQTDVRVSSTRPPPWPGPGSKHPSSIKDTITHTSSANLKAETTTHTTAPRGKSASPPASLTGKGQPINHHHKEVHDG